MECTVYNHQTGRLETIEIEFTADNKTHFTSRGNGSVTEITDWDGGLLIKLGGGASEYGLQSTTSEFESVIATPPCYYRVRFQQPSNGRTHVHTRR